MKQVLVIDDTPTIPKLTNDLEGFRLYVKAGGHWPGEQLLKNFDSIIKQQKEKEYAEI